MGKLKEKLQGTNWYKEIFGDGGKNFITIWTNKVDDEDKDESVECAPLFFFCFFSGKSDLCVARSFQILKQ